MMITLRVRTPTTVHRISVPTGGTVEDVYNKLPQDTSQYLSTDPQGKCTLPPTHPLSAFSHGDFLFLHRIDSTDSADTVPAKDRRVETVDTPATPNVDMILSKRSGRVTRRMDPRVCRHGPVGMCEHCQPLEPWQTELALSSKHLPLHAHLRRHKLQVTDNYQQLPQLDDSAAVCERCRGVEGVRCGRCGIRSAVPLKLQPYRLVDHVLFKDKQGVEAVVEEWRGSGLQRFAYLFGTVIPRDSDEHDLGVAVSVEHIYQPPSQHCATDGVQLAEACEEELRVACLVGGHLNLQLVGCIYTDLSDDGTRTGKVIARDHIISAAELSFMAHQQRAHERFVTCVIAGTKQGEIEPAAYMASDLMVALCRLDMVSPSTDPDLLVNKQCEFLYTEKNEYGFEVPVRAKAGDTVPVDYFIVSLSHGFAPSAGDISTTYPQPHLHPTVTQAIDALATDTHSTPSRFNLLLHLTGLFGEEALGMDRSELYANLLQIHDTAGDVSGATGVSVTCPHCTFINEGAGDCAMCGLPL